MIQISWWLPDETPSDITFASEGTVNTVEAKRSRVLEGGAEYKFGGTGVSFKSKIDSGKAVFDASFTLGVKHEFSAGKVYVKSKHSSTWSAKGSDK